MEVYFKPGDVVWVKLGPFWWPGEVADKTKVPEDVTGNLKREPVAIIQFFDDEEYYECVKSTDCIYHYNCERKNDFIKKGMDAYRANNPKMAAFPKDIGLAEEKTGGNASILSDPMFTPERKRISIENLSSPSSKKIKYSTNKNKKKKPVITHRRFVGYDDYESHVLIQHSTDMDTSVEDIEEDLGSNFKCHVCSFTTDTLNILMMHSSCHHTDGAAPPDAATPSGPSSPRKIEKKKRKKPISDGDSSDDKKEKTKRKNRKRKDDATSKDENDAALKRPKNVEEKKDVCVDIIADWDDESNQEATDVSTFVTSDNDKSTTEASEIDLENEEKPQNNGDKKEKESNISCFDFDEDEEVAAIPDAKSGRKIPRVIPVTDKKFDLDEFEVENDDDEEEETKKKLLEESGKLAIENVANDGKDAESEELDKTYKLLMDSTQKIELPDIPNALKSEQNFHCARAVKYPDKSDDDDADNDETHQDVENMTSEQIQEIVMGVKETEVCTVPYEEVVHSENLLSSLDAEDSDNDKRDEIEAKLFNLSKQNDDDIESDLEQTKETINEDLNNKKQNNIDIEQINDPEETTPKTDRRSSYPRSTRHKKLYSYSRTTHRGRRRKSSRSEEVQGSNSEETTPKDSKKRRNSSSKDTPMPTRRKSSSREEQGLRRRSSNRLLSESPSSQVEVEMKSADAARDTKNVELSTPKTKDVQRSTRRSTRSQHHQEEDQNSSSDTNIAESLGVGTRLRGGLRRGFNSSTEEELLKSLAKQPEVPMKAHEEEKASRSDKSFKHRKLRHSQHNLEEKNSGEATPVDPEKNMSEKDSIEVSMSEEESNKEAASEDCGAEKLANEANTNATNEENVAVITESSPEVVLSTEVIEAEPLDGKVENCANLIEENDKTKDQQAEESSTIEGKETVTEQIEEVTNEMITETIVESQPEMVESQSVVVESVSEMVGTQSEIVETQSEIVETLAESVESRPELPEIQIQSQDIQQQMVETQQQSQIVETSAQISEPSTRNEIEDTTDPSEEVVKPRKPSRWDQKEKTNTNIKKKKSRWDQVEVVTKHKNNENVIEKTEETSSSFDSSEKTEETTNSLDSSGKTEETTNSLDSSKNLEVFTDLDYTQQMSPVLKFDNTINKHRKTPENKEEPNDEILESVESQVARITHYEEADQNVIEQEIIEKPHKSTMDIIEEMESVDNEVVIESENLHLYESTTTLPAQNTVVEAKVDKEESKIHVDETPTPEKIVTNEVATKLTNPKKRFVKSFEESNKQRENSKMKDEKTELKESALINLKKKILAKNSDVFSEKNLAFRTQHLGNSDLDTAKVEETPEGQEVRTEEQNIEKKSEVVEDAKEISLEELDEPLKSNVDEAKIEIITKNFPIENEKEEPELVPLDGNLTVVSEKELSEGQVELAPGLLPKKPSLLNFSMDFSDDSMDNSIEILKKEKIMDIAASLDVSKEQEKTSVEVNTTIEVNTTTVENTIIDQVEEKLIQLNEGVQIVQETQKIEKKSPKKHDKKTQKPTTPINEPLVFYNTAKSSNVTEMCDLEDHIPSQIVCAKKALMDEDVMKVAFINNDLNQDTSTPKTEPGMSKLMSRLTNEENSVKEVDLKSLKLDTNAAKTLIKTAIKAKPTTTTTPIGTKTGNKAIILSERIIKPATTLSHIIKKNYEDVEGIKPYVIAKNQKMEFKQLSRPTTSKTPLTKFVVNKQPTPGKAKILNQTIIRPAAKTNVEDSSMDFDINSMPIVLSDELLTPETLENMPIVLSDQKQSTTSENLRLIQGGAKVLNRTLSLQSELQASRMARFKKTQQVQKPQTYQKIIRHTSPALNPAAKSGKYVIVPENSGKLLKKPATAGVIKRPQASPGLVSSSTTTSSESSGHKIMIVTNPQGQQQRLLLSPAHQKVIGQMAKNQTNKPGVQQKTLSKILNTVATTTMAAAAAAASRTVPQMPQPQAKFAQNRKVQKVYVPQNKTSSVQKTILIKNQHGQTVRKIHGTDDAALDRQVAEQIEAIKVNSLRAQQRQQELNAARSAISKPIVQSTVASAPRRSYPRKADIVKQPVKLPDQNVPPPPLTPFNKTSDPVKKEDTKPVDRPLNQLVIQDNMGNQTTVTEGQILALPSETVDGQPQSYMLVTLDESGNLTPLNNEALMSLDPSLVGLGGDLSNMVFQMDATKDDAVITPTPTTTTSTAASKPQQVEEAAKPPPVPVPQEQTVQTQVQVTCNINGEPGQQIILTGDPVATQKFLDSLSEGNTDLANILANAEGSSFLIQTDGQQILINTDPNNERNAAPVTDDAANPMFAPHHPVVKNQDILAAALADTDMFQQDHAIGQNKSLSPAHQTLYPMNVGNVLETSLTLNSPIMTPLEVPSITGKKILDDDADILTHVPKNVDLPITITDPNISHTVSQQVDLQTNLELSLPIPETITTGTEINSPSSYVYALPNLDEHEHEQKTTYGANMPLLTEDVVVDAPVTKSVVLSRLEQVNTKTLRTDGTATFMEEGLCTLGGEMCSSLSEPPPEMFETNDKNLLVNDEIEIPVQPQIVADLKDCLDKQRDV